MPDSRPNPARPRAMAAHDSLDAPTRSATQRHAAPATPASCSVPTGTNYFCPVCGWEFLPEEIGKKPYCRRCGYLES